MWKALAVATIATLGFSAAAQGAKKQRVVIDRFTEPYSFAVDCSEFGSYDFENLVSGVQRVSVVEVRDEEGTLLQTVFNIGLRETEENSVTGKTVPLSGAVREVWDYASDTRTVSGKVWLGTEKGEGTYVHDTGRITMTLEERVVSFEAGPKEAFYGGGIDVLVCAALSAE